jgi:hypothetical protein
MRRLLQLQQLIENLKVGEMDAPANEKGRGVSHSENCSILLTVLTFFHRCYNIAHN